VKDTCIAVPSGAAAPPTPERQGLRTPGRYNAPDFAASPPRRALARSRLALERSSSTLREKIVSGRESPQLVDIHRTRVQVLYYLPEDSLASFAERNEHFIVSRHGCDSSGRRSAVPPRPCSLMRSAEGARTALIVPRSLEGTVGRYATARRLKLDITES
jgi:hypothetical protein